MTECSSPKTSARPAVLAINIAYAGHTDMQNINCNLLRTQLQGIIADKSAGGNKRKMSALAVTVFTITVLAIFAVLAIMAAGLIKDSPYNVDIGIFKN